MKRITITQIQLPNGIRRLHDVTRKVWIGEALHTPELYSNLKRALNPSDNDWYKIADVKAWICEYNDRPAGVIIASLVGADDSQAEHQGYFSILEFSENQDVAITLISTARTWLYGRGAKSVTGPVSLPPLMGYGVMITGQSTSASYGTKWSPKWYSESCIEAGLKPIDNSFGWELRLQKRKNPKDKAWHPPVEGLQVQKALPDSYMNDYHEVERLAYVQDIENGRLFSPYQFSRMNNEGVDLGRHVDKDGLWVVRAGDRIVGGLMVQPDINPTIKSMKGRMFPVGWLYWAFRGRRANRYRISMVTLEANFREVDTLRSLLNHMARVLTLDGAVELEFSQVNKNDREMIAALRGLDATESKEWVVFEA